MTARPLLLALALCLAPALTWADEAVSTANGTEAPMAASNTRMAAPPLDPVADGQDRPDRRVHGEVGVSVGSDGYRAGYLILDAPLGERGRVGIAVSKSEGGRGYRGYRGAAPPLGRQAELIEPATCVTVENSTGGPPAENPCD